MAKIRNGHCTGGMFCDGTRPMTWMERRAYNIHVASLGGPSSPAGRAWIEAQHRLFLAERDEHRRLYH
jgi:hypothetical protein